MNETKPTDSPKHYIPPKSTWTDADNRLIVCWEVWNRGQGYSVELMVLDQSKKKPIKWVEYPWETVKGFIDQQKIRRIF